MRKFLSNSKAAAATVFTKLKSAAVAIHQHCYAEWIVFTAIMYFTVEILSRRSFVEPFTFIFDSPIIFVFNFLIVALTMSLSLISYHRYFFYMVNAAFWLTISIATFVLQSMRANPLSAIDFEVVVTALDVIPKYIGWIGIILIIGAFVFAGVMLVILWRKCPKPTGFNRLKASALALALALCLLGFTFATSYTEYIPDELESPVEAYDKYGFPYCFFRSFFIRGVVSPDEYSEEQVQALMDKLPPENPGKKADELPNVVFLQLESFFDVNKVNGLELNRNPIPVFTSLKQSCPGGKFSVNTIGGGTANTEFEVLCGMNLAHFGLLECPYTTMLHKQSCESLVSVMNDAGFTSHAIHNHTATFYSRHLVYGNLGFDSFTPIEYMKNAEFNILDWAKDSVLAEEIVNSFESTEGNDFVFTVSVQPHGKYPDYETASDEDIQVLSYPYEELTYEVEYYINQLYETDRFLGDLIDYLEDYDEDVVLVVYGDHLPTLGLESENMFDGDVYSTEYVIWSNCNREFEGGDIQAYQLSAKILEALDISGGEMFRIHRELADNENYDGYVQLMAYDMLIGENYAGANIDSGNDSLEFGTLPITVSSLGVYDDVMFVSGENFTRDSYVFLNDRRCDTVYISDTLLLAKKIEIEIGDAVYVAQLSDGSTLLSQTASLSYSDEMANSEEISQIFGDTNKKEN